MEFAVLPAGTPEQVVLGEYITHLTAELGGYNATRWPAGRMRLRLAIDTGVATTAALGFSGPAPIAVARYLNAPEVKRALAAAWSASLAVVISDRLYQDVVRSRFHGHDPKQYRRIHVEQKGFAGYGWVRLPGVDPHDAGSPGRTRRRRGAAPGASDGGGTAALRPAGRPRYCRPGRDPRVRRPRGSARRGRPMNDVPPAGGCTSCGNVAGGNRQQDTRGLSVQGRAGDVYYYAAACDHPSAASARRYTDGFSSAPYETLREELHRITGACSRIVDGIGDDSGGSPWD